MENSETFDKNSVKKLLKNRIVPIQSSDFWNSQASLPMNCSSFKAKYDDEIAFRKYSSFDQCLKDIVNKYLIHFIVIFIILAIAVVGVCYFIL